MIARKDGDSFCITNGEPIEISKDGLVVIPKLPKENKIKIYSSTLKSWEAVKIAWWWSLKINITDVVVEVLHDCP